MNLWDRIRDNAGNMAAHPFQTVGRLGAGAIGGPAAGLLAGQLFRGINNHQFNNSADTFNNLTSDQGNLAQGNAFNRPLNGVLGSFDNSGSSGGTSDPYNYTADQTSAGPPSNLAGPDRGRLASALLQQQPSGQSNGQPTGYGNAGQQALSAGFQGVNPTQWGNVLGGMTQGHGGAGVGSGSPLFGMLRTFANAVK